MSQTHTCQFKTQRGRECLHHLREEFPIRFSPKLGMYLCAQHEQYIIKDHMSQFYDAQIRHKDLPNGVNGVTYNTFSTQVFNRFLDRRDSQYLPTELPINQCLYSFNIVYAQSNSDYINCNILIQNEPNYAQIGISHNAEIRNFFSSLRLLFHQGNDELHDELDRFFANLNMNTERFNINMPPEIHQRAMEELRTQFENERNQTNIEDGLNEEIELEQIHTEPVSEIIRVESPVPVFDDDSEEEIEQELDIIRPISNIDINPNRQWSGTPGIRPRPLELTMIDFCHICVSEQTQKGFKMSCCNSDNQVCVDCVINHQLLEHTKYHSFMDIKTMSIFYEKQPCFFCRHSNSIENMINDIDCKQRFSIILHHHIYQEMMNKIENHMTQVNSSIGLN